MGKKPEPQASDVPVKRDVPVKSDVPVKKVTDSKTPVAAAPQVQQAPPRQAQPRPAESRPAQINPPQINQAQINTPPSEEAVRVGAYLRWDAAGRPGGDGVRFWLEAEQELLTENVPLAGIRLAVGKDTNPKR